MSKLTFYEFTQLSEHDQYDITFREGDFVEAREINGSRYALYKLYNFFVEVEYNISLNKIINIVSFINTK